MRSSTLPISFADRVLPLKNEGAYAMMKAAARLDASATREHERVVHLEIGQPTISPPPHVVRALSEALERGETKYVHPKGTLALRETIARYVERTHNLPAGSVLPENVIVGPGAKPGLVLGCLALLNPGDEVLIPDPGFPTYRAMVELCGAIPVPYPLLPDTNAPDVAFIGKRISNRTKLIVINSPGNPTGGIFGSEDTQSLKRILADAAGRIWLMTDEIYSRLHYLPSTSNLAAAVPPSVFDDPEVRDRVILVDGLSKTFAMTGFRIGYAVVPSSLAERMEVLAVHSFGCVAPFVQHAAVTALTDSVENDAYLAQAMALYRANRDVVLAMAADIPGCRLWRPDGAFYAWLDVSAHRQSAQLIVCELLERARVAVLPGTDFGAGGEGFLRVSYAGDTASVREGMRRIQRFFAEKAG
eukprot:ctg_2267.g608